MEKLFVIHVSAGLGGGVLSVIKNLIAQQKKENIKLGIVFREDENQAVEDDLFNGIEKISCKKFIFPGSLILGGLPLKKIYKVYSKRFPEYNIIFHVHNASAVGLIPSIKNIKIICTIHGQVCGNQIAKTISNLTMKKILKYNNILIGVSDKTTSYYNKILYTDKVKSIRNGVTVHKEQCRVRKNSDEKFSIGYISYLNSLKGWSYLVDAYKGLEMEYKKHIKLHLVGGIEESNKPLLEEKLKDIPTTQIEYYGEIKNAGECVTPYMNIVILPSQSEGIPMCLLESMAFGIPILATEVGGIPEILKDSYTGFFINRDENDIRKKIVLLYDNPEIYDKMKNNTLKLYKKDFDVSIMSKKYMTAYLSLLEEK